MNTVLVQRGEEIAHTLMTNIASNDCLNLTQCINLVYAKIDEAGKAGMQRKIKKMMNDGLIGRKQSGDGLYRYYLNTAGVEYVNQFLNYEATAGHDRSYLNSAWQDKVVDKMIEDVNVAPRREALGRGALRRIKGGRWSGVNGILGERQADGSTKILKVYVRINAANEIGIKRYEEANVIAVKFKAVLSIISSDYVKKCLGLKKY